MHFLLQFYIEKFHKRETISQDFVTKMFSVCTPSPMYGSMYIYFGLIRSTPFNLSQVR